MSGRKHRVNQSYFKKWSHNMSYILGLWFADGCISRGKNIFDISLHKDDEYLLRDILKEMDSTYPIFYDKNVARFQLSCKKIYEDVVLLGGKDKKSLDAKFPIVPVDFIPDFIRGYFDGDGSIFLDKSRNRYASSFSCGSKVFIDGVHEVLSDSIPSFGGYVRERRQSPSTKVNGFKLKKDSVWYELSLKYGDTEKLGDFMYSVDVGLRMHRKHDRFLDGKSKSKKNK